MLDTVPVTERARWPINASPSARVGSRECAEDDTIVRRKKEARDIAGNVVHLDFFELRWILDSNVGLNRRLELVPRKGLEPPQCRHR